MTVLKIKEMCKKYDSFYLDKVSFSLDLGYIMGFIGSNGAGKTTTIKGIMNLISRDGGSVEVFGRKFNKEDIDLKQDIALMLGGSDYYRKRKIETIAKAVRPFYKQWDEKAFRHYLKRFKLDPEKRIEELSQGMGVKFSLALALSHNARLLILDEPTSGLDPAARDDLLELFQELVESGERSILFSTHITSDLEKCADRITFIDQGKIIRSDGRDEFLNAYRLISGQNDDLPDMKQNMIAWKTNSFGYQGLIEWNENNPGLPQDGTIPTLEEIMIYYAKKEDSNEKTAL